MADESGDNGRSVRGVANGLAVASLVMMTAATATLTLDGPEWLMLALAAGFALFAALAGFIFLAAGRQPAPTGKAARQERAQWQRWQNCLFTWPLITTNFALLAVHEMRDGAAAGPLFPLVMPAFIVAMLLQIFPLNRGERGTTLRRQYEDLVDELSREHAATAFRSGYFALLAGATGILVAALYAPAWTAEAAVGAIWLGFVVPCVRFGLLQWTADRED